MTSTISEEVKQACRLYESILSAVSLADIYSPAVKRMVACEVEALLSFEEADTNATQVLKAYLQLLKE